MLKSTISSWVRQARHRAKKHEIHNDLEIADIESILVANPSCAYCIEKPATLDHPFPLKDGAPNVPANVLPICRDCKDFKKYNDLVWLFHNNKVNKDAYLSLIEAMLTRRGSELVKNHIKKVTGIVNE